MSTTRIEWATAVLNAATGCTRVSAGCDHCYAETLTRRLRAMGQPKYSNGFAYTEHPAVLHKVEEWQTPERIFVNSMSDFFHEQATYEFVRLALDMFCRVNRHTYLILTKRPGKMRSFIARYCRERGLAALPPHLWLGVSVEHQEAAALRIPPLGLTPCQVRFLSCEPLLGPLDLRSVLRRRYEYDYPTGAAGAARLLDWPGINWVIAGGESGRDARPMDLSWARDLRAQCQAAQVPFFFKQVGGPHHAAGGRLLDGRTWDEVPPEPWRRRQDRSGGRLQRDLPAPVGQGLAR